MVFPPKKQQIQSFWEKQMLVEMCSRQDTCFSMAQTRLLGAFTRQQPNPPLFKCTQCYLDVSYQGSSQAALRAALASVQSRFPEFCSVYHVSVPLLMVATLFFRIVPG